MPLPPNSDNIEWFRYPFVAVHDLAKTWLTTETLLGLAPNTLTYTAERTVGPDVTCRSAYNNILQAEAYIEKGWYPIATSLAEEALPSVRRIQSEVNLARINSLHANLVRSSYGNSSDVARLGAQLLK